LPIAHQDLVGLAASCNEDIVDAIVVEVARRGTK
jgi:hypothetical protein